MGWKAPAMNVLDFVRLTSSQGQAIKQYTIQREKLNYMILQKLQTKKSEILDTLTLFAGASRVNLLALLDQEEDLKTLEELSSLKLHDLPIFLNPSIFFLKTLKDSLTMTEEKPLKQSSERLMDWGMMSNGKCLTAKISPSLKIGSECSLSDILEKDVPEGFFLSSEKMQNLKIEIVGNTKNPNGTQQRTRSIVHSANGIVGTLTATDYKEPKQVAIPNKIKQFGIIQPNYNQSGVVYDTDGISPTLRAYQGGNLEPKIRVKEATKQGYAEAEIGDSVNLSHPNSKTRQGRVGKQIANTLLTGESQGVVEPDFRIRKLTPRECWRLQGFPDWAFDKAQEVNSNSQLYKQAGNSVTVNVIAAIAERL